MASGDACHTFALNQAVLVAQTFRFDGRCARYRYRHCRALSGIVRYCHALSRIVWKFSAAYHASVHQG
ncbi:MAG TPA: hypothetical protein VJ440_10405 [Candidatus Brocadiaceae bacterium]|nr:hypothetical protein [Candidatus Brocadiaceae bacterium]